MSLRAIIIGFFWVLFISGFGYINDRVLDLESFSNGHQLPIIVIGFLLLTVLILNPLLRLIRKNLAFKPAELALIVTLATCSCGIPGRALMEHFAQNVIMPYHWYNVTPGWQTRRMLDYFPKDALVVNDDFDVVNRFHIGTETISHPNQTASEWIQRKFALVPWKQWIPPLRTWMPFILLTPIAMAALALVVHKQWSEHEHLQYPIAEFITSLIDHDDTKHGLLNTVLTSRMFWLGFIIVFLIRLNNGLCQWFPEEMIPVKLYHSLSPFYSYWPQIHRDSWGWGLMRIEIFPLVTAFAFLLSAEISFTLGISMILWCFFAVIVVGYGYSLQTDYDIGGWEGWNRTGAYIAYTLIIIYTGRFYYANLFRHAFGLQKLAKRKTEVSDAPAPGAVMALRIFLICTVALCLLSIKLGLSWPIAIGTIVLMLISFLILARLSAETGLFFIQPGWQPFGSLMTLFGAYAIGPTAIVISALICGVLCIDQSQAIMPYLINGLKMGEKTRLSTVKLTNTTIISYIIGIAVAIVVVIIASYDYGTPKNYWWSYYRLPTMPIRAADPAVLQLKANDVLAESEALTGFQRLLNIRPSAEFLWAVGVGFFGVIIFSILRLRTRWWPLHPCMFLLWATYPMCAMSHAFLGGWILKKLALKFGGNKLVQTLKPLCIGVIAADVAGALVFMLVGAIYYFATGEIPKTYRFFPR